jgi:hypothetical protein
MNPIPHGEQTLALVPHETGELVFTREIPSSTSLFGCLRLAWQDAQWDARSSYEAWTEDGGLEAYAVYRAAQERADAAQDALARCPQRGR